MNKLKSQFSICFSLSSSMNGYDHETYNLEKEKSLWPDKDKRSLGRGRIKNHLHTFILFRAFEDTKSNIVLLRTNNLETDYQNLRLG